MTLRLKAPDLSLSQVEVRFTDHGRIFTALSVGELQLADGASLAMTGPSGCGKSTLLFALAGLLRPTVGRILWGGDDISAMSGSSCDAWRRRNVGFIFQDFELLPELSALENVLTPATFAQFGVSAETRRRALGLLDRFSVPIRGGAVSRLSRGERQRVALARALLFDPPIILADEPTASLDEQSGEAVIAALVEQAHEGRIVIAASHDPRLISQFNARLRLGRSHAGASPRETAP